MEFFYALYEDDIISDISFYRWRDSPEFVQGKGVALRSVVQFYQWLSDTT